MEGLSFDSESLNQTEHMRNIRTAISISVRRLERLYETPEELDLGGV
ncbi:MAG: hypothetical protein IJX90_03730 [Blautia sp.]|nr:hypothetical protein [Blautia sp.]